MVPCATIHLEGVCPSISKYKQLTLLERASTSLTEQMALPPNPLKGMGLGAQGRIYEFTKNT